MVRQYSRHKSVTYHYTSLAHFVNRRTHRNLTGFDGGTADARPPSGDQGRFYGGIPHGSAMEKSTSASRLQDEGIIGGLPADCRAA